MNLVQKSVQHGGKLAPLVISEGLTSGTGLMNPSIFIDNDGDILVNLRHVNYTLYHAEGEQKFPSRWGPLGYLHPERDQRLVTTNYICKLNADLEMTNHALVEMLELHQPIWEFVGLEDCRLVQWNNDYYLIGVRRDTTTNGRGRMEYTKIILDKENWTAKEISRERIETLDPSSYCEKNWVPIIHKPYHFVKWTSPVEIVKAIGSKSEQVSLKQGIQPPLDQRGSSQVVKWKDHYISITHEVNLFKNYLNQKDGIYTHRICVWNEEMDLIGLSPKPFTFLDGRIEFCVGAAVYENDLLISFGFQDNAAFVLRTPGLLIDEMIEEALIENKGKLLFDIGANRGDATWAGLNKGFNKVVALEPAPKTFNELVSNYKNDSRVVTLQLAASNSVGAEVEFYDCVEDGLSTLSKSWLTDGKYGGKEYETITAKTITIDKLVEEYGVPDLIKIDVEGAETLVFQGMTKYSGMIAFEWTDITLDQHAQQIKYLSTLGYTEYAIQFITHHLEEPTNWLPINSIGWSNYLDKQIKLLGKDWEDEGWKVAGLRPTADVGMLWVR